MTIVRVSTIQRVSSVAERCAIALCLAPWPLRLATFLTLIFRATT